VQSVPSKVFKNQLRLQQMNATTPHTRPDTISVYNELLRRMTIIDEIQDEDERKEAVLRKAEAIEMRISRMKKRLVMNAYDVNYEAKRLVTNDLEFNYNTNWMQQLPMAMEFHKELKFDTDSILRHLDDFSDDSVCNELHTSLQQDSDLYTNIYEQAEHHCKQQLIPLVERMQQIVALWNECATIIHYTPEILVNEDIQENDIDESSHKHSPEYSEITETYDTYVRYHKNKLRVALANLSKVTEQKECPVPTLQVSFDHMLNKLEKLKDHIVNLDYQFDVWSKLDPRHLPSP